MYQSRNLVLSSKKNTGEYDKEMTALREGVRPEWYENWYDGLGFCKSLSPPDSTTSYRQWSSVPVNSGR